MTEHIIITYNTSDPHEFKSWKFEYQADAYLNEKNRRLCGYKKEIILNPIYVDDNDYN